VRAAPNREMVADWRVSPGGTATAAVKMRQGPRGLGRQRGRDACSLGRGQRRERGKTEESAVPRMDPFEAEVGEVGERWGSLVRRRVEERMGQRQGAMSRGRPNRGGERGLTGGSRPQYRVAALADRRARAAQYRAARI
jgi:hypothetical protein